MPPVITPPSFEPGAVSTAIARKWLARAGIVARLAAPDGDAQRQAHLHISFGALAQATDPWGARFWEEDAPAGVQPVEWILGSQNTIYCVEDALQLLSKTPGLVSSFGCH